MEQIKYVGCDDPKGFLDVKRRGQLVRTVTCGLDGVDESGSGRIEPYVWHASHNSAEEFLAAEGARQEARQRARAMLDSWWDVPFPDVLRLIPGVEVGSPVDGAVVGSVVREMESLFGFSMAEDYRRYLEACGTMTVGGIQHTGVNALDGYDILRATRDMRGTCGISGRYYPLAVLYVGWSMAVAFFQDPEGYVYVLERDGTFKPWCLGLKKYVFKLWRLYQGRAI